MFFFAKRLRHHALFVVQENATDGEYDANGARFDRRLREATDRVFELEESIVGKQTALERLVEENDSLRQQLDKDHVSGVIVISSKHDNEYS